MTSTGAASVRRRPFRVLAAVLLVGAAAWMTGAGAWALMEDDATAAVAIGAGTVDLAWPASGTSQLEVPVGPLLPGESAQHVADLTNTGTVEISRLQLTFTGTGTGSSSDGMQVALSSCGSGWVPAGAGFTCSGAVTEITPSRPVDGVVELSDASARAVGGLDHLLFTFSLPSSSPPADQNAAGRVTITADGVQGPGRQR